MYICVYGLSLSEPHTVEMHVHVCMYAHKYVLCRFVSNSVMFTINQWLNNDGQRPMKLYQKKYCGRWAATETGSTLVTTDQCFEYKYKTQITVPLL